MLTLLSLVLKGEVSVNPSSGDALQPAFHTIVLSNNKNETGVEFSAEAGTELVLVSRRHIRFQRLLDYPLRLRVSHWTKLLSSMAPSS
jgi:hypothetical protein